jgi:hypothetical protein
MNAYLESSKDSAMPPAFKRLYFTALVRTAAENAFRDLQQRIESEKLYAFGLYTNGEGTYVLPTANTEEALARKASAEAVADGHSAELHQQSLRWSPCDWEYHEIGGDAAFAAVEAYLETGWADDYSTFHYDADMIYVCCLDALNQLRHTHMFSTNQREARILLNLFMGDQSDEARLEWAAMLNDADQCIRFQHELVQGYLAFRRLADAAIHGKRK